MYTHDLSLSSTVLLVTGFTALKYYTPHYWCFLAKLTTQGGIVHLDFPLYSHGYTISGYSLYKVIGVTFADGESGGGLCGERVGRCMKLPRTFFHGDVTGWITCSPR